MNENEKPERAAAPTRPGGDETERLLILATPEEAKKLLSALGDDAMLIRLAGLRGIGGED